MHKLDRTIATEPACLAGYDYRTQSWDDVPVIDKQRIRQSLAQMQGAHCAYCEGPIYADGHIEHFRRKNPAHFPQLAFCWANLFLSCGSLNNCGHYKDRPNGAPYDPNQLVKPDEHDPDDYFYFHSSGEVRARSMIDPGRLRTATETIRVFNLDCGTLRAARRRTLRIYQQREPGILEILMDLEEQDRQEFITGEVQATRQEPHWTVIRHFFERAY